MVTENDLQIGDMLGGFKIEKVLGRGGMGVVFKAHELSLNRKIALKVLASRLSSNDEFIQRFKREAQVIAALKHPNIVNILSYGQDRGLHYFAMEYVQGKDLGEILREKKMIPFEEALAIVRQVADALSEAGLKGVVHRDIKPSNIMIDPMGRAYVTDFGVAHFAESSEKLTQTGLFLGTPEYSSPEQAKGLALDIRSDIYSLGAVLYKMVSGRPPVTGESPLAVVVKISTEPVTPIAQVNPSVPPSMCDLIAKMMARNPEERYLNPKALLEDIDRCQRSLKGIKEAPPAFPSLFPDADAQTPAAAKPRRSMVGILGGILGIAMAVFMVVWLVEGKGLFNKDQGAVVQSTALEQKGATDAGTLPASDRLGTSVPDSGTTGTGPEATAASASAAQEVVPAAASAAIANGGATAAPPPERSAASEPAGEVLPAPSSSPQIAAPARTQAVAAVTAPKADRRQGAPPVLTRTAQPDRTSVLPKTPVLLVIVSGEESMAPLTRSYLYAAMKDSGLKILTFAEVPVLREKMRIGRMPVTWYDIKQIAPPGQAQILVLAEIIKTGAMPIRYMGRTDELTHAAFTLHVLDMDTGAAIHSASSDTIKFTAMNMDQKLKEGIAAATFALGNEVAQYWEDKVRD